MNSRRGAASAKEPALALDDITGIIVDAGTIAGMSVHEQPVSLRLSA